MHKWGNSAEKWDYKMKHGNSRTERRVWDENTLNGLHSIFKCRIKGQWP